MDTRIVVCAALAALACSQGSEAAPPPPPQVVEDAALSDWIWLDRTDIDAFEVPEGRALVITQTWGNTTGAVGIQPEGGFLRELHKDNVEAGDRYYTPGVVVNAGDRMSSSGQVQVFGYLVDV